MDKRIRNFQCLGVGRNERIRLETESIQYILLEGLSRFLKDLSSVRTRPPSTILRVAFRRLEFLLRPKSAACYISEGEEFIQLLSSPPRSPVAFLTDSLREFFSAGLQARAEENLLYLKVVVAHHSFALLVFDLEVPLSNAEVGCLGPYLEILEIELLRVHQEAIIREERRFLQHVYYQHLRPNAIYYNFLRVFTRVFRINHSILLLRPLGGPEEQMQILAERLLWKGAPSSDRVGSKIPMCAQEMSSDSIGGHWLSAVRHNAAEEGPRAGLFVPIDSDGRCNDVLVLLDTRPDWFRGITEEIRDIVRRTAAPLIRLYLEAGEDRWVPPQVAIPGLDYKALVHWASRQGEVDLVALVVEGADNVFNVHQCASEGEVATFAIENIGTLARDVMDRELAAAINWIPSERHEAAFGQLESLAKRYRAAVIEPVHLGVVIGFDQQPLSASGRLRFYRISQWIADNIRYHDELEKFETIASLTSSLARAIDHQSALQQVVDTTCHLLSSDFCYVWSLDQDEPSNAELLFEAASPLERDLRPPDLKLTDGVAGRAARTGQLQVITDVSQDKHFKPLYDRSGNLVPLSTELAMPLLDPDSGVCFGVIDTAWRLPRKIAQKDLKLLSLLATRAVPFLSATRERAALQQKLEMLQELLDRPPLKADSLSNWLLGYLNIFVKGDTTAIWSLSSHADHFQFVASGEGEYPEVYNDGLKIPVQGSFIGYVAMQFQEAGIRSARDNHGLARFPYYSIPGLPERPHSMLASTARLDKSNFWVVCLNRYDRAVFSRGEQEVLDKVMVILEDTVHQLAYEARLKTTFPEVTDDLLTLVRESPYSVQEPLARAVLERVGCSSIDLVLPTAQDRPSHVVHSFIQGDSIATSSSPLSGYVSVIATFLDSAMCLEWDHIGELPQPSIGLEESESYLLEEGVRSVVGLKLTDESGRFRGVMLFKSDRPDGPTIFRGPARRWGEIVANILSLRAQQIALSEERTLAEVEQLVHDALPSIAEDVAGVFDRILSLGLEHISRYGLQYYGNIYIITQRSGRTVLEQRANRGPTVDLYPKIQEIGEGIIGKAAKERRLIHSADVKGDNAYLGVLQGMRSEMAVPVFSPKGDDRLIGVLNFESPEYHAFNREQQHFLELLANKVAFVVYLGQVYEEMIRILREREDKILVGATKRLLHSFRKVVAMQPSRVRSIIDKLSEAEVAGGKQVSFPLGKQAGEGGIILQLARPVLDQIYLDLSIMVSEALEWDKFYDLNVRHLRDATFNLDQPVDLFEVIHDQLDRLKEDCDREGIKLENKIPASGFEIHANSFLDIPTVIANLVDNSIRALKKGLEKAPLGYLPRIWLEVRVEEGITKSVAIVTVSDNGPGIPQDLRARLFYVGAVPSSNNPTSLGIGLSTVREVMTILQGDVQFLGSVPFEATTFSLRFVQHNE